MKKIIKIIIVGFSIFVIAGLLCLTFCEYDPPYQVISKTYSVYSNQRSNLHLVDTNRIIRIGGHLLSFPFDSNYLIVLQKPQEVIDSLIIKLYGYLPNPEIEGRIFKESRLYYYWIVNLKNDSIWGPMNKSQFIKKRKELGVSKKLKFEEKE